LFVFTNGLRVKMPDPMLTVQYNDTKQSELMQLLHCLLLRSAVDYIEVALVGVYSVD